MFKRVLVATDFSRHADRMLECIGEIYGMEGIVLVHVIHPSPVPASPHSLFSHQESPDNGALKTLETERLYLESMTGVPVTARLVEGIDGDTAGAIVRTAKTEDVSLIVMGGRGQSLLRNLILGSVSEAVIRKTRHDILIMHFRGMDRAGEVELEKFCRNIFSHLLCPVDFSKPSHNTLGYLKELGIVRRVTLLHVMDPSLPPNTIPGHKQAAEQRLAAMEADLTAQSIRSDSLIRTGTPAQEIGRVAEERDVSLILIARYGQLDYAKNIPLGRTVEGVMAHAKRPLFVLNPHVSLSVRVQEIPPDQFYLAEQVWTGYHGQKGDILTDRIFGVFVEDALAAVARCRRHHDGLEVDGVFVPEDYRGRGYARSALHSLINACGHEPLFMHATLELVSFYATFGFVPVNEPELPPTIRERFNFAEGELEGSDVRPMKRPATGHPS